MLEGIQIDFGDFTRDCSLQSGAYVDPAFAEPFVAEVVADSARVVVQIAAVGDGVTVPGVSLAAKAGEETILAEVGVNHLGKGLPCEGDAPASGLDGAG